MSKFTAFMAMKVVVCIGSDSVENVFSVGLVGLGGRWGPGDVDHVFVAAAGHCDEQV